MKLFGHNPLTVAVAALGAQHLFHSAKAAPIPNHVERTPTQLSLGHRNAVAHGVPTLLAPRQAGASKLGALPTLAGLSASDAALLAGGEPTVTVVNHSGDTFTVALFPNAGVTTPSFGPQNPVHLSPETSATTVLGNGWSGSVRKVSGAVGDPSTWGELTYSGGVWADVSYIRGNNGPMTIKTTDGALGVAGTAENLVAAAPAGLTAQDSGGHTVLPATEPYTGGVDQPLVDFYRANNNGAGYVRNFDNQEVHFSANPHVVVEFY